MEYKNLPDLSGLAALRAVVERGGVSNAANILSIGQPAVTKRLRVLEACYGATLMERVAGRLRLTAAGQKVYTFAVQTLDRNSLLNEDLQSLADGSDLLRLDVTTAIGEHFLPELLLQFSEHFPQYKINSRLGYWQGIQTRLVTGLADLAIMENAPDHPDILVQKWLEDELWLTVGPSHPFVRDNINTIDAKQLTQLSYVLRERQAAVRETTDEALRNIGITDLNIKMEVGSTDAIVEILQRGGHVSFLPRFTVQKHIVNNELFHIKISNLKIKRTLWIARNRSSLDHHVAEVFIRLLREY
ncbi:LysR family transcriptional regulator [Beggiatoa alba]|nr:LysR family transcriptional regulator [Beggiatoa alba]